MRCQTPWRDQRRKCLWVAGRANVEVVRQRPPRAAGPDEVEGRVYVLPPPLRRARTPAVRVLGHDQPGESSPGGVGDIRRVGPSIT